MCGGGGRRSCLLPTNFGPILELRLIGIILPSAMAILVGIVM